MKTTKYQLKLAGLNALEEMINTISRDRNGNYSEDDIKDYIEQRRQEIEQQFGNISLDAVTQNASAIKYVD